MAKLNFSASDFDGQKKNTKSSSTMFTADDFREAPGESFREKLNTYTVKSKQYRAIQAAAREAATKEASRQPEKTRSNTEIYGVKPTAVIDSLRRLASTPMAVISGYGQDAAASPVLNDQKTIRDIQARGRAAQSNMSAFVNSKRELERDDEISKEKEYYQRQDDTASILEAAIHNADFAQYVAEGQKTTRNSKTILGAETIPSAFATDQYSSADKYYRYRDLTEDQKQVYDYYVGKGDTESADAYLEAMTPDVYAERAQRRQQIQSGFADEHPVAASLESLVLSPVKSTGFLSPIMQKAKDALSGEYHPIDPNSDAFAANQVSALQRQMVSQKIAGEGGIARRLTAFGYETLMSVGDMAAAAAATGGVGAFSAPIIALGAGGDAIYDAKMSGASDSEAVALGLVNAATEWFSESQTFGRLEDIVAKGSESLIANMAKEGGEEVFSEIVESLAELGIRQDESKLAELYNGYIAEGYDSGEAFMRTVGTELKDAGIAFAGGALAGGIGEGGAYALYALNTLHDGSQIKNNAQAMSEMKGFAAEKPDSNTARYLQVVTDKYGNVENAPGFSVGRLAQMYYEDVMNQEGTLNPLEQQEESQQAVDQIVQESVQPDASIRLRQAAEDMSREQLVGQQNARTNIPQTIEESIYSARKSTQKAEMQDLSYAEQNAKSEANTEPVESSESSTEIPVLADTEAKAKTTGEDIIVNRISSVENGTAYVDVTTDNGRTTMRADDVDLGDGPAAQLLSNASRYYSTRRSAEEMIRGYNGHIPVGNYLNAHKYMYLAGLSGMDEQSALSNVSSYQVDESVLTDAYEQGLMDAAEKQSVKKSPKKQANAGVQESEAVKRVRKSSEENLAQLDAADRISRALGISVRIVDDIDGANGYYLPDGEIVISASSITGEGSTNGVLQIFSHELTHNLEDSSPEAWKKYRDFVNNYYMENDAVWFEDRMEQLRLLYDSQGIEITHEELMNEMAANATEDFLFDEAAVRELCRENRSLAQKVVDLITDIIEKMRSVMKGYRANSQEALHLKQSISAYSEARALWLEAIAEAKTGVAQEKDAKVRYILDEYDQHQIDNWASSKRIVIYKNQKQYAEFLDESMKNRTFSKKIYFGKVDSELARKIKKITGIDAAGKNVSLSGNEIRKIIKDHGDAKIEANRGQIAVTKDILLQIPDIFNNPDRIGTGGEYNGKPVIVFTKDIQGRRVAVTYVSDRANDLIIQTVYASKKSLAIAKDEQASFNTPEATYGTALSESSIRNNSENVQKKFSLKEPVEQTKDLIAMHNLTEDKLLKAMNLGGFPMPSIAVTRSDIPHTNFGDITLVMDRSTVDAKRDKRNTVYSADGYTPTFPAIEYDTNPEVEKRVRKTIREILPKVDEVYQDDLRQIQYELNYNLNRAGGEAELIRKVMDKTAMKAAYLESKGEHVERIAAQREIDKGYREDRIPKYKAVLDVLGLQTPDEVGKVVLGEAVAKYKTELEKAFPGMTKSALRMGSVLHQIQAYLSDQSGEKRYQTVTDAAAMRKVVDDAVASDMAGYERWVSDLFVGIEAARGVRNNKKVYTPAGNLRSFKQLHYPATLDGITRAMVEQNNGDSRNVYGFYGVKSLRAGTAKRLGSIVDMHKEEWRLKNLSQDQLTAIQDNLDGRLVEIINKVDQHGPGKGRGDIAQINSIGEILQEIAESGAYTIDSISATFNDKYSYQIGNDLSAEIRDLLFDVSQMPVNLFEAKPERSVGFNEVRAAIVPDSSSQTLRDRLENLGIPVLIYQADNDGDRIAKVNSVDNVRFSLREEDKRNYARLLKQNEKLRQLNADLKEQLKLTKEYRPKADAIRKVAKSILKEYSSTYDQAQLEHDLDGLFRYIANAENIDNAYVSETAQIIARNVLNKSVSLDTTMQDQYSDLLKTLRKTKLSVSKQDQGDFDVYGGFGQFKRQYRGSLSFAEDGTSVDTLYQELSDQYPEFFDETQHMTVSDQLMNIADTIDAMQPQYENPFGMNRDEAVADLSYNIYDRYFGTALNSKTFADKKKAELERTKAHYQERIANLREEYRTRQQQRIEEIRQQNAGKIALLKERQKKASDADKAKYQARIDKLKNSNVEKLQAQKKYYTDMRNNERLRRSERKERRRLLDVARKLAKAKTDPSIMSRIDELIGDLDLKAMGMQEGTRLNLEKMKEQYLELEATDPDFIQDRGILESIARLDKRQINDLSIDEVRELTEQIIMLQHGLEITNSLINHDYAGTITQYAGEVMSEIDDTTGTQATTWSRALNKYEALTLSPQRMLRRMSGFKEGSRLSALGNDLNDGAHKMIEFQRKANELFREFTSDKTFANSLIGKKARNIEITGNGKTYLITPAMRMSLYLANKNPDNQYHMMYGGVTIPETGAYNRGDMANAYGRGDIVKLMPSMIEEITGKMTEKEKRFADRAHEFFNVLSKDAINETSLALDGFERAIVDDYFPIKTDNNFTRADISGLTKNATIEGMGMLKDRKTKASNPILLEDITRVLERQIDNVSRYYGLAIPVRNMNKVLNVSYVDSGKSVKRSITNQFGKAGMDYITKMMSDIQGGGRSPNSLFDVVKGKFAGSVLMLNLSVTMKQTASYPTAAAVLGWKPLAKALAKGGKENTVISAADRSLIDKYTPLLWYRNQGNSTSELGDITNKSTLESKVPWLLGWIQKADSATVGRLWYAAEYYVDDHYSSLEKGSDTYYQRVAEAFNRAVEETQPNYTTMQRPDVLRSDNALVRSMTMFMTQRLQNANILYDSFANLRAKAAVHKQQGTARSQLDLRSARKEFANAVSSQIVSAAVISLMTLLSKALLRKMDPYRDEDGMLTEGSIGSQVIDDFLSTIAGSFLGGSELFDLIYNSLYRKKTLYDIENNAVSRINDIRQGINTWASALIKYASGEEGYDESKVSSATLEFAKDLSLFFGFPTDNAINIVNAIKNTVTDAKNGDIFSFDAGTKLTRKQQYAQMSKALVDGDRERFAVLYNKLISDGVTSSQIESGLRTWLKGQEDIQQAYDAKQALDLDTYKAIVEKYVGYGFKQDSVVKAINAMSPKSAEENDPEATSIPDDYFGEEKGSSVYSYADLANAALNLDADATLEMISDYGETGKDVSKIRSTLSGYLKDSYQNMNARDRQNLKNFLVRYYGYSEKTIDNWLK